MKFMGSGRTNLFGETGSRINISPELLRIKDFTIIQIFLAAKEFIPLRTNKE